MIMSHLIVLRIEGLKLGVEGYRWRCGRLLVLLPPGGLCRACCPDEEGTSMMTVIVMVTVTSNSELDHHLAEEQ